MAVAVEDLTTQFWSDLILHHISNQHRLDDSHETDEVYGMKRWLVRMWYDISEYILMAYPDEDLHNTIQELIRIDQVNCGHTDYSDKMVLHIAEYVTKLSNKYSV